MIKKSQSIIFTVLICWFISLVHAEPIAVNMQSEKINEPSPFGITIKETTIDDIKQKYKVKNIGISQYSGGQIYSLDTSQIDFDGIKSVNVIFDKDNKALAVSAIIAKSEYKKLFAMLSNKYKLISNQDAFVGDRQAEFVVGDTNIMLNAPHLSFELYLTYMNKDFHSLVTKELSSEKEKRNKETMEKL